MLKDNLIKIITEYFGFLVDKYSFIIREKSINYKPSDDGVMEYISNTTIVSIILDRLNVILILGPLNEPEIARLSLENVIAYITQSEESLVTRHSASQGNYELMLRTRLSNYANLLQKYCVRFLIGDFSTWIDICKYTSKKMHENYQLLTGEELPMTKFDEYVISKKTWSKLL